MSSPQGQPAAAPSRGGGKKWLVLAAGALALAGAGVVVFQRQKDSPASDAKKAESTTPGVVELEPFVLNLADPAGDRYLRLTVRLALDRREVAERAESGLAQAKLRDGILSALSKKRASEVTSADGRESLRSEVRAPPRRCSRARRSARTARRARKPTSSTSLHGVPGAMIRVTRLDRHEIALNCDLIESIEARPDTTIRLVTGQSQVVREDVGEVLERIRAWRASVLERAGLAGLLAHPVVPPPPLPRSEPDSRSDYAPMDPRVKKLDIATIAGLGCAFGLILLGNHLRAATSSHPAADGSAGSCSAAPSARRWSASLRRVPARDPVGALFFGNKAQDGRKPSTRSCATPRSRGARASSRSRSTCRRPAIPSSRRPS
jgi:uncharacterized protein YlzI (FlbEa/FlbD family)/flagellar basal body-associated protein FliL